MGRCLGGPQRRAQYLPAGAVVGACRARGLAVLAPVSHAPTHPARARVHTFLGSAGPPRSAVSRGPGSELRPLPPPSEPPMHPPAAARMEQSALGGFQWVSAQPLQCLQVLSFPGHRQVENGARFPQN